LPTKEAIIAAWGKRGASIGKWDCRRISDSV
jgi:hypothetical protein